MDGLADNWFGKYKGKKVFITGHTGFKGSWACRILELAGAEVFGYDRKPGMNPKLFNFAGIQEGLEKSIIGDVRDLDALSTAIDDVRPEIVIHFAAQPIVRKAYQNPVETYEINVMGTVNLLEAVRECPSVRSVIVVTTDKVYQNKEWVWGYREDERLNGFDPYSNSKSCAELVVSSYKNSFFNDTGITVSSCRSGNVVGGGDFQKDRIIPDCVRAVESGEVIQIRNPFSTRPYQHVLEPVWTYLQLALQQLENPELASEYNIGPDEADCVTTGYLAELFCATWGKPASWEDASEAKAPHEANFLKLDCSKIKSALDWSPRWHIAETIEKIVEFEKVRISGGNMRDTMDLQIREYLGK